MQELRIKHMATDSISGAAGILCHCQCVRDILINVSALSIGCHGAGFSVIGRRIRQNSLKLIILARACGAQWLRTP